jgi:hypothetical protein
MAATSGGYTFGLLFAVVLLTELRDAGSKRLIGLSRPAWMRQMKREKK